MEILTYKQLSGFKENFLNTRISVLYWLSIAAFTGFLMTALPLIVPFIMLTLCGIAVFNCVKHIVENYNLHNEDSHHHKEALQKEIVFASSLFVMAALITVFPIITVPLCCYVIYRVLPDNLDFEDNKSIATTNEVPYFNSPSKFESQDRTLSFCVGSSGYPLNLPDPVIIDCSLFDLMACVPPPTQPKSYYSKQSASEFDDTVSRDVADENYENLLNAATEHHC